MKYLTQLAWIVAVVTACPTLTLSAGATSPAASGSNLAQAQPTPRRSRRRLDWRVGVRASRYRIGAFSRSGSCSSPVKIVPFVPPVRTEERINSFKTPVEQTFSSRPTFWVYVSDVPPNTELQFTLQDARGNQELYAKQFTLNQETGLVGVYLPQTAPELAIGETYYWELSMNCADDETPVNLISASGWVQRVNPQELRSLPSFDPAPLVQELAKAPAADKPALYAGLGIWQDAVTALIELRQKQPQNRELLEDWQTLLTGAQMSQYVNARVLLIH